MAEELSKRILKIVVYFLKFVTYLLLSRPLEGTFENHTNFLKRFLMS